MAVRQPPASLGDALCFASWQEQGKANLIQTETEDGSVMVRRRFTNRLRFAEASVTYEASKYDDFMTFFNVTLRDGLDQFPVREPNGTITNWRFTDVPNITWTTGAVAFSVSITLMRDETWP